MNNVFIAMNANFEVSYVSNAAIADDNIAIIVKQDALQNLGAIQLVAIAKSLNEELKVNTKQNRAIIVEAINVEIEKMEIRSVSTKSNKVSTKDICWAEFDKIDMNEKQVVRNTIDSLVITNNFNKAVVQSYASDYRKAKRSV